MHARRCLSIGLAGLVALSLTIRLSAQESSTLKILSLVKAKEREEFGLTKLSDAELRRLDDWTADLMSRALESTVDPVSLEGATIIAGDGEFIGRLSNDRFDAKSLGNKFGDYGSKFDPKSLLNKFSEYGSRIGNFSAFDRNAGKPPVVLLGGKAVAYLTRNPSVRPRVDPYAVLGYVRRDDL
jgi:hypothetical protein